MIVSRCLPKIRSNFLADQFEIFQDNSCQVATCTNDAHRQNLLITQTYGSGTPRGRETLQN